MEEKLLDWEDNVEGLPFLKHMLAGSCAGITEHSVAFPFDTLRTYAQAESTKLVSIQENANFIKTSGFVNLWRGVTSVLWGCVPAHAVYFSTYEIARKYFKIETNSDLYLVSTAVTGAIATAAHDCIMNPMDVVKQRIQLTRKSTPLKMLIHISRTEGVISLYRSLPITLVMNIPQAALFMTLYENFKSYFFPTGNVSILGYFTCAGIAGAISSGITTPLDVVKTRLQTQTEESSFVENKSSTAKEAVGANAKEKAPKYVSVIGTFKTILQEEGFSAFYRGVIPRMLFVLPGAAVSWSAYEHIKTLLI